jgi:Lrp/AsnC family leucine-responsive transcriptional regulator
LQLVFYCFKKIQICGVICEAEAGWEEVAQDLAKIEGVVSVFAVSDEVDLMLEIVARDIQHYFAVRSAECFQLEEG